VRLIDLEHLDMPEVIGVWLADGCLIDCGPSTDLDALLEGLDGEVPGRLLLTHIHLDHAGAAGALVRRWPDLEVWVHEKGARHLADPAKLLASARRLYGDDMDRLWGEVLPVPEANLHVLRGGETVGPFLAAATPGHASHHVAYLHEPNGVAFTGDVGGVRIPPDGPVMPPTPPPDIDLDAWSASLDVLESWRADRIVPTHFGSWDDVEAHLGGLREALAEAAGAARRLDANEYAGWLRARVGAVESAPVYDEAMPFADQWAGLDRALR